MEKYLYSNALGTFVFDEKFQIVEKIDIAEDELPTIENNEWTESEKSLINKYQKDRLYFIGFKKAKQNGIILSQDQKKIFSILNYFNTEENLQKLYSINLKRTKQKIKESTKKDLLIIQVSDNIEGINKSVSLLVKRLREWYELYNPEFSKSISDHEKYIELILSKNRKELLADINLKENESMGADLEEKDISPILELAKQISNLYLLKNSQEAYLDSVMAKACPNLKAIAGSLIGAKLVSIAGSLKNLAEMPSSTIQVLGAERALFRHLRNKNALPPKYGVIMQHPLISNANRKNHGKVARALASKIAIAVKMDYFGTGFIGDELKKSLEARFP